MGIQNYANLKWLKGRQYISPSNGPPDGPHAQNCPKPALWSGLEKNGRHQEEGDQKRKVGAVNLLRPGGYAGHGFDRRKCLVRKAFPEPLFKYFSKAKAELRS